ncbi:hypothetical protein DV737_g1539, partial [Chaetothyriales sp. CBS 132003]
MSSSYHTKNNRTSKRGAFINGVWHCDCEPRLPADKFQTKNGGKNHGRWFYTCQQPQHKRCPFFLWADGAKLREEGATPEKTVRRALLQPPLTPQSRPKLMARLGATAGSRTAEASPSKPPTGPHTHSRASTDEFSWSSGNDEDLASALDMFETPHKPRKQPLAPAAGSSTSTGTLTSQVLSLLAPHNLPADTMSSLTELLASYELRTAGITKGRDLTRLALQQKDGKIAELQSTVQGLEREREMLTNVISLLKSDMATNTKRGPRRPRGGGGQGEGEKDEN